MTGKTPNNPPLKKMHPPQRWWQYADKRPAMREAIQGLDRVLVITLHTKIGLPLFVETGQVFSHALGIFATDRTAHLSLLSSNIHFGWWTEKGGSTLETRLRYTPSDGFETFPQPELTERMDQVGAELDSYRRSVMLGRESGLTKLYNLVHDERVTDEEIRRLRDIHAEIDEAVAEAYGWSNLVLGHGFHETRQGTRYTIDPAVQVEILDRLLELNRQRHAEEIRQGLHSGKRAKPRKAKAATRTSATESSTTAAAGLDDGLFPLPDALF